MFRVKITLFATNVLAPPYALAMNVNGGKGHDLIMDSAKVF